MAAIRVLIAEDSSTVRELLRAIIDGDPRFAVVGVATNGVEAVQMAKKLKPDVITMDIQMPLMDGFEASREIMIDVPTPIVIVSSHYDVREITVSMQALSVGALAVHAKPLGPDDPKFADQTEEFLRTLYTMSQVHVIRHVRKRDLPAPPVTRIRPAAGGCRAVAIAISTGGPAALRDLFQTFPANYPAPVLVVQHISRGFIDGLATWLNAVSAVRVKVAEQGESLQPRTVYLAPDDRHLGVTLAGDQVYLADDPPIKGFRPSGTYLFESVAKAYGANVVGVIMTGMGDDGVVGLRAIHAAGGPIIAQDEESSVVFGMPARAIDAGLADVVLPLTAIVDQLAKQIANGGATAPRNDAKS
ncbi:MAG: chemotaxis-specific protein-glutamate methyltransferase CheB [Candidatus Lustribacter sp.]|jgi:two-component system chemotaxis response regulator CheB